MFEFFVEDFSRLQALPNGYVYVKLFDKIEESHVLENMRIQQQWRDWAGYNELL
jgi:hypothetical protein